MKRVVWHPKALETVRDFPKETKKEIGYLIYKLQLGETLKMPFSRPIKSVGKGIQELRVKEKDGIYRVFYFLKSAEGILIFHAFGKKTQKTALREIETGIQRLKELIDV